ncbi:kinesin-like protein KIN-14C [Nymphaea colorata]|nr:kinesin-like protein KIN-14C [Nymphaea colorata]
MMLRRNPVSIENSMRPQVNASFLKHLRTSLEDGEIGSPRIGSPRVVSPKVGSSTIGSPRMVATSYFSEPIVPRRYASSVIGANAKQRAEVVEWLNGMFHSLRIPSDATEEDLRRRLFDGMVLCGIMKKLKSGFILEENVNMEPESPRSLDSPRFAVLSAKRRSENVKKFLSALDDLGLPTFDPLDLEQGPVTAVVECLLNLKNYFTSDVKGVGELQKKPQSDVKGSSVGDCEQGDQANKQTSPATEKETPKNCPDSRSHNFSSAPVVSEPYPPCLNFVGQKFTEVFQLNEESNSDLLAIMSSAMVNPNDLDNAPTQSLLYILYVFLGDKRSGEVSSQLEVLFRKIMQEIERRLSTQGEQIRKLKLALKEVLAREERLVSRAGMLETLATGTSEEIKVVTGKLQKLKIEKSDTEMKRKLEEQHVLSLMKEKEQMELEVSSLSQELETAKRTYEQHCLDLETQGKEAAYELKKKIEQLEFFLEESKRKIKELETVSESRSQKWKLKEVGFKRLIDSHLQDIGDLRLASQAAKKEVLDMQRGWLEEISNLSVSFKRLADAAEKYHMVLDENRKLYNEVQDLKGNIRVYCRIRPFLPGEAGDKSIIDYIGDDGDLLVSNPSKPGRDGQHMFKFSKVFGPRATQEEVFMDTQPLIRSVLDGFNVCIFAYGQTGSGKTFTMTGPEPPSEETWGVNYRALNDLFLISQKRSTTCAYEVEVQMVEIYNEQVHDLLTIDGLQKKLGIWSASQHNGLSIPDASMHHVSSTADVLALMQTGHMNRAIGATAMNERSSRSHSILTVHVRGTNLQPGTTLRGSLHLVDLAGSERVDRSEATGNRLREAQHINKSLSALGDVIYALAQKSPHIPYRNSKLTQILQGSLGGQAKTLMFVQINPDIESYSESLSTLKFAERVSGVELGAAKINKESKEIRDLTEQVAQLKELALRKDAEIQRLQLLLDRAASERRSTNLTKCASSLSPKRPSQRGFVNHNRRSSCGETSKLLSSTSSCDAGHRRTVSDVCNYSEYIDRRSDSSSEKSVNDLRSPKEHNQQPKLSADRSQNAQAADVELLGFGDAEERLSDISDSGLSMGADTDDAMSSMVELNLLPEAAKDLSNAKKRSEAPSWIPRPPPRSHAARPQSRIKDPFKPSIGLQRPIVPQPTVSTIKPPKRWQ